jgi:hypothetical protein
MNYATRRAVHESIVGRLAGLRETRPKTYCTLGLAQL